jgi:hypothetical protein
MSESAYSRSNSALRNKHHLTDSLSSSSVQSSFAGETSISKMNFTHRNESAKETDSDPAFRPDTSKSTRQQGERRGRPYSHRGDRPEIKEATHFTTIWQAELNYRFAASGCSSAYSTDKHKPLCVEQLIPTDPQSQIIFQQIKSNSDPGSRSARLYDMLYKLTFARS